MLASGNDLTPDLVGTLGVMIAGSSSGMLIPVRFVWPYGGSDVSLVGSFTRWNEHLQMSPMDGYPTVFQVVCSLTPGIHQYKFFVDGEWRHDEQQSFVKGDYGIVNTIILAQQPGSIPTISSPVTPSNRGNMDVDHDALQLMGTSPRISGTNIDVFRSVIAAFLSSHTSYELLPVSGKVIVLDINLPVKQAFHILYEQGVPIAPLMDSYRGEFVGVLSPLDFILIMKELGDHGSNLTEEELETHTIFAWKQVKMHRNSQVGLHAGAYQRQLISAGPYETLKDVAFKILQSRVSTVPIIYSSSQDGSFPQLLHLASLSGILKCICRHFGHSSSSFPILQQTIDSIPLGTWVPGVGESNARLMAMQQNAPLSSALTLLLQAGVSSIPIVDENDSLLETYSRSDIMALARDGAYARIHLDNTSIHQALQLGQDANSPHGLFSEKRCQMCLRSDTLQKVMEQLADPGVRRLIVVEAGSKRVEGIISLSDVFRFLLGLP